MEENEDIVFRLKELKDTMKIETEIWDFVDCLLKDLELCKNHNRNLEKQLENLGIQEEQSLPGVYVKMRERNSSLQEKNSELEEKMNNLGKNIKEMKEQYNLREKEFFDELQMAQIASALDFEKIEQKLKWQLSEANKKIQENNIIITKLQMKLRNMEEHQKYTPNAMFFSPVNDAIFKENKAREDQLEEYPINDSESLQILERTKDNSVKQTDINPTTNSLLRTYEPLQVKCSVVSDDKTETKRNAGKQVTPLFKGKNYIPKRWSSIKRKNPTMIPPLMPCTSSKQFMNRKRRLHDPDDLNYLVQLMGDEGNDE